MVIITIKASLANSMYHVHSSGVEAVLRCILLQKYTFFTWTPSPIGTEVAFRGRGAIIPPAKNVVSSFLNIYIEEILQKPLGRMHLCMPKNARDVGGAAEYEQVKPDAFTDNARQF